MTERGGSRPRRRRHAAAASRVVAAGLSASLTFGLAGAFAAEMRAESAAADARSVVLTPPTVAQPDDPPRRLGAAVPAPARPATGPKRQPQPRPRAVTRSHASR
jgi:hypothetical protein